MLEGSDVVHVGNIVIRPDGLEGSFAKDVYNGLAIDGPVEPEPAIAGDTGVRSYGSNRGVRVERVGPNVKGVGKTLKPDVEDRTDWAWEC